MIGKLTGIIDSFGEDNLIVDVNGVGYLVYVPSHLLNESLNAAITLFIETQVREDAITLFGFKSFEDKKMFNLLKTVQGVGAKLALAVLSKYTTNDLQNIIMLENTKAMQEVSGVGAKVALRVTSELKDKIAKLFSGITVVKALNHATNTTGLQGATLEARAALLSLGYTEGETKSALSYVATSLQEVNQDINELTAGDIVKKALGYFSPHVKK